MVVFGRDHCATYHKYHQTKIETSGRKQEETTEVLHMNLGAVNFQGCNHSRNQNLSHQRQDMSETAACHPIPLADHPSTLPSPTSSPPPVSDSCLFTRCQPLDASHYTVLLYFPRYCTIRLKMFSLFFLCLLAFYILFV